MYVSTEDPTQLDHLISIGYCAFKMVSQSKALLLPLLGLGLGSVVSQSKARRGSSTRSTRFLTRNIWPNPNPNPNPNLNPNPNPIS